MAKIEWKSQDDIDAEEREPTELEKLKQDNDMLAIAIMELTTLIMKGGE